MALTGCLVQGSGPAIFVIENAKKDAKSDTEKGVSYIVVASSPDLNLRTHLNHEVTITGQSDGKTAPATGTKFEEKDLPKLTAKNVTMVSNTCAVVHGRPSSRDVGRPVLESDRRDWRQGSVSRAGWRLYAYRRRDGCASRVACASSS